MRTCYYCNIKTFTAFYLNMQRAWACVECYVEHYIKSKHKVEKAQELAGVA